MSRYQLAQLNVGVIRAPMESPVMAEFADNLDRINAVADGSPGFVWRLQTDDGNATAIRPFENENLLVNLSVWQDADALRRFVYTSAHADYVRRRREWFEPMNEAFLVLWWVPRGHLPTLGDAKARLERLRAHGPTAEAFTFRKLFPPPDAAPAAESAPTAGQCSAT